MKIITLIACCLLSVAVKAQNDNVHQYANKVAKKMQDSLNLSNQQKKAIIDININLHQQEMAAISQHKGSDSLGYYLQRIENKRDGLYKSVLPEEKYVLYKRKKINLLNNN